MLKMEIQLFASTFNDLSNRRIYQGAPRRRHNGFSPPFAPVFCNCLFYEVSGKELRLYLELLRCFLHGMHTIIMYLQCSKTVPFWHQIYAKDIDECISNDYVLDMSFLCDIIIS